MRSWRLALLAFAGVVAAFTGTVLAVAVNVATGGTARWFPPVGRHPLWWTAGATAGVACAGLLAWAAQRWYERGLAVLVPAVQQPEPWVVDRPGEVDQIVAALRHRRGETVGITTAVHGTGGFGKTTVAKLVGADRRVLRRFKGRVYWVTLGRDLDSKALTGRVNGLITQIEPGRPVTFTDARQAGAHLAAILAAGPRRLVVLDDVWSKEQADVFPVAGRCARLVTTRNPSLAAGTIVRVKVDQMSEPQARALLLAGLPPLPPAVATGLVNKTGRWPLLLHLINKFLADQARADPDITPAAKDLLDRLRRGEVAQAADKLAASQLTKDAAQKLDVRDPEQRNKAVRATIEASTSLLTSAEHDRFAELGVFAEDETIPVTLITALWQATSELDQQAINMDQTDAKALCAKLADLALITFTPGGGAITLHDVIRDFLRDDLGGARLAQLDELLLDAVAANLPPARPLDATQPTAHVAWWDLGDGDRYLWDHLIDHLQGAARRYEADALAGDLRWVEARLKRFGPAGPSADLSSVATPRAVRLQHVLARAAHLLAPTEPAEGIIDVLHSRVACDPDWKIQVAALHNVCHWPRLVNRWLPPDLADDALRNVLTGRSQSVKALAAAPDGTWLASGSRDGTVRIWNIATGQEQTILKNPDVVAAVAVAPDGSWLAIGSWDRSVQIWDIAIGQERTTLKGHQRTTMISPYRGAVETVAVAADGTWLASGGTDKTVRIWDMATGQERAILKGHTGPVVAVMIAPDGTWLASGSTDKTVRVWDMATGQTRAILKGHSDHVAAVAIAPDGSWLASGARDGTVRIWDVSARQERAILESHTKGVEAVAIAPDGSWLALGTWDGTVQIWDVTTGQEQAVLRGHSGDVQALAVAPDGSWLASGSRDGTVRIWDVTTRQERGSSIGGAVGMPAAAAPNASWLAPGDRGVTVRIPEEAAWQERLEETGWQDLEDMRNVLGDVLKMPLAVAPDGTWLASGTRDGTVQIWDAATGQERASLKGHSGDVKALAVAPDGRWLASGSKDKTVRIWDMATKRTRAILKGHNGTVVALAVAPNGRWLATGSPGEVRIWDVTTRERAILANLRHMGTVAIAPDGTWLASSCPSKKIRIWDVATKRKRAILKGHSDDVKALAVAPDGSWLASSSRDGTVRIWEVATWRERGTMEGHGSTVDTVAIAPDGNWLASGTRDGTVRIWDVTTRRTRALMRIDDTVNTCAWLKLNTLAVRGTAGIYLFDFLTE